MKIGFTISLRNQVDSQLSGEQPEKKPYEASESSTAASFCILGCCIIFTDYLKKENAINREYYMALLMRLKDEIAKNGYK